MRTRRNICSGNKRKRQNSPSFRILSRLVLLVILPLLNWGVATAQQQQQQQQGSSTSEQTPAKFCPTCKHFYAQSERFCAVDGVPLIDVEAARENTKLCPRCKKSYSSRTRFCPQDGAPLVESGATSPARDGKRVTTVEHDNATASRERAS